jgi:serine/threonine protein kinase
MAHDLAGTTRIGKLASGGSGVVYLVRHPGTGALAAAKTLFRQHASDPTRRAAFARECEVHQEARHPHLPACFGTDPEGQPPALVVELLRGESVGSTLDHGPLPVPEACTLGSAVAGALDRLHDAGWLHRDVKPSNLFHTHEGRPVLVDLGAASRVAEAGPGALSALYAAPELLDGGDATPASDLYGLGATLYHALAGIRPFEGAGIPAVREAQRQGAPPLGDLAPTAPPALVELVEALLAPHPEERPGSAREVERGLTAVLRALARDPEDPADPVTRHVLKVRLLALDAASHGEEAAALLASLDAAAPHDPWVPWVEARLARHRGQPVQAVAALREAEARGLSPARAAEARGRAFLEAGRLLEAHAAFEDVATQAPEDRFVKVVLAWLEAEG